MIEKKLSIPRAGVPKPTALKPTPMPTAMPTRPVAVAKAPKPLAGEDSEILEKALMRRMKTGQNC